MRDLAQAMNCDASYVTAVVDDLERAGYANRRTAPADRRVKTVVLTAAGRLGRLAPFRTNCWRPHRNWSGFPRLSGTLSPGSCSVPSRFKTVSR